jgi:CBS-domain-containing membrane protein
MRVLRQYRQIESRSRGRGRHRSRHLPRLLAHHEPRHVWAAFILVNALLTMMILGALARITGILLIFPSIGPTAILCFLHPHTPNAAPRNALLGHAIGLGCGYASLLAFGLTHAGAALPETFLWSRVLAVSCALAATSSLMVFLRTVHPPAGATTLIVSMGLVTRPLQLCAIELSVALLVLLAIAANRMAGIDFPLWSPRA